MAAVIAERPSHHWERVFAEGRAPAVAHRTTAEWLQEDHPRDAELLIELEDPCLGPLKQPGKLVWLQGYSEHQLPEPAPSSDADRSDVLALRHQAPLTRGLTTGHGSAETTSAGDAWLSDVTILDMTNVIAGPTIAGTLARFGAQITKLDPVKPTFDPWNTVLCGLQANRGKRSLLADVTEPDGAALLDRLIARADVIVVNATSRQVERLGLTRARLAAVNPNVVLCQLDAWSGPNGGPWSERLGYDDLVQAATGITTRFGGGPKTPRSMLTSARSTSWVASAARWRPPRRCSPSPAGVRLRRRGPLWPPPDSSFSCRSCSISPGVARSRSPADGAY